MTQLVSLTSQGQVSIPTKMLELLNVKKPSKVTIKAVDGGWLVKPVANILSFGGSLHKYAIKGKTPEEIRKMEKEGFEKALVTDYTKKYGVHI